MKRLKSACLALSISLCARARAALFCQLLVGAALASPAADQLVLVKDINTIPTGNCCDGLNSFISLLVPVGTNLFFRANDGVNGLKPYKSDGTAAGTVMLKNIDGGEGMANVGGRAFFRADDGTNGMELWTSDATEAGTVMVRDIRPGAASSMPLFILDRIVDLGGVAYFQANDGVNGFELWKSDGTAAGTVMVKDINPGSGDSGLFGLFNLGGTLFFVADDGVHGWELWKSDGTEAGTVLVKDVAPGVDGGTGSGFAAVGGILYFLGYTSVEGAELWRSDGTEAGTFLVKDINAGGGSSSPSELTGVGTNLFFIANTFTTGWELWKSDGTAAGTVLVKDIAPGGQSSSPQGLDKWLVNFNGALFFNADDGVHGVELWKSDGTAAGTVMVKDIAPGDGWGHPQFLRVVGSTLFFSARTGGSDTELWKTDGTAAGTVQVKDIFPGVGSSTPNWLVSFNGALFFVATDPVAGRELWKSDGTGAGTVLVKDINTSSPPSNPSRAFQMGGEVFFWAIDAASGQEPWKTSGDAASTMLLKDVQPGAGWSESQGAGTAAVLGGRFVFRASTAGFGAELWVSDGTAAGTQLLKDINPGAGGGMGDEFGMLGGHAYFSGSDGVSINELWKTDGTTAGTVLVKDIGGFAGSIQSFTTVGSTLFFTAAEASDGNELWKTDGTTAGTVKVKDIRPGSVGSVPADFINVNGTLFFTADDTGFGSKLWKSDGTSDGTVQVSFISSPSSLFNFRGTLFFAATDGSGKELWKSDGTAPGTELVKDIRSDSAGSSPFIIGEYQGKLYFAADDGVNGYELWRTDGTTAGTVLFKDINSGMGSSSPGLVGFADGQMFIAADDGVHGYELWKSDGTVAGTVLVQDINPGSATSFPFGLLTASDGSLYFTADDGIHGTELWRRVGETSVLVIRDTQITEGNSGAVEMTLTVTLSPPSPTGGVSVSYATADGTALAGLDYIATNGVLNFGPDQGTNTLRVQVLGDTVNEPNETIFVQLSNLTGPAILGDPTGVGTILNDDLNNPPVVGIPIPDQNGAVGQAFSYAFPANTFTDPDAGQTLSYTASGQPPGIAFNGATRTFIGTPTGGGGYTVTVTATDNGFPAASVSDQFVINVTNLVYEPFDNAPGLTLSGLGGGMGFAGNWSGSTAFRLSAGSLSIPGLVTSGGMITNIPTASTVVSRSFASPIGATGTVAYFSMIVRPDVTPASYFGVDILGSPSGGLFVGRPGGVSNYGFDTAGGGGVVTSSHLPVAGSNVFLVVKCEFFAGNDRFTLYINPLPGAPEPSTGTVKFNNDIGVFTGFNIVNGAVRCAMDELRFGSTYAQVTPGVCPPQIIQNPANSGVTNGQATNLTVVAAGQGPLAYQWRKDGVPLGSGASYSGVTSNVLTVTGTDAGIDGSYDAVATSPCGAVTSQVAAVTFLVRPTIVEQPASIALPTGGVAVLRVVVTNTANVPIAYRWRRQGQYFRTNTLSQRMDSLVVANLSISSTGRYEVVITNQALPGGLISAAAFVTLTNDTFREISVADAALAEGQSGAATMIFNVSLSAASPYPVSVAFATVTGSAAAGTDFIGTNGVLTFDAAETAKTVAVSILGDTSPEPNESFTLALSNPTNVVIVRATATGTILTDDSANTSPNVAHPIPDTHAVYGTAFNFTFAADTFSDPDAGQTLSYTAGGMPQGILFDGPTRTFSGTNLQSGAYTVSVIATDNGLPPMNVVTSFSLNVSNAPLAVAADNKTRIIGETNPPFTGSLLGLANGDNISARFDSAATLASPAGAYQISVTLDDPGMRLTNYMVTTNPGTLTILPLPTLNVTLVGGVIQLSWPTNYPALTLICATNLDSAVWMPALPAPVVHDDSHVVTSTPAEPQKFYRLRRP